MAHCTKGDLDEDLTITCNTTSPHQSNSVLGGLCKCRGRALIHVLGQTLHKKCQLVHNRIYLLLSLCDEGRNIQVGYSTSHLQLYHQVPSSCRASFCLCAIHIAGDALQIRRDALALDQTTTHETRYYSDMFLQVHSTLFVPSPGSRVRRLRAHKEIPEHGVKIVRLNTPSSASARSSSAFQILIDLQRAYSSYRGFIEIQKDGSSPTFSYQPFHHDSGAGTRYYGRAYCFQGLGLSMRFADDYAKCAVRIPVELWLALARSAVDLQITQVEHGGSVGKFQGIYPRVWQHGVCDGSRVLVGLVEEMKRDVEEGYRRAWTEIDRAVSALEGSAGVDNVMDRR